MIIEEVEGHPLHEEFLEAVTVLVLQEGQSQARLVLHLNGAMWLVQNSHTTVSVTDEFVPSTIVLIHKHTILY